MKAFIEQFRHLTHTAEGEKPLFEVVGKAFAKDSGWSRFVGGDPQVVYDDTATEGSASGCLWWLRGTHSLPVLYG